MKKVLKIIVLIVVLMAAAFVYQLFHFDNRYVVNNETYQNFKPQTKYQTKYPVANYVDERMDASAILRSGVIGSMVRYDDLVTTESTLGDKISVIWQVFVNRAEFINLTQRNQFVETIPLRVEYVGEQETHNFEYIGYLEDGTEVRGNLAIWGNDDEVLSAISYQDGNGNVDANKAKLFTDDSNAEMMAYLLIEAVQEYMGTEYEPNEAALAFFNCSLENVAGSISYHAAASLSTFDTQIGDLAFEKVKTANLSTIDEDGYFVNQSY
ncbi:hypothetical protein RZE82_05675 [Mollicutes bacterium LVI A0039]|nr:hypothetical protein RZE82_05675 [Mollicutes bacterium LVI A0039]